MNALVRLAAGMVLAAGLSSAADAATVGLPSTGGGTACYGDCTVDFTLSASSTVSVTGDPVATVSSFSLAPMTMSFMSFGYGGFGGSHSNHYSWNLYDGFGHQVGHGDGHSSTDPSPSSFLTQFLGRGRYSFHIRFDDPTKGCDIRVHIPDAPIPGSGLLFGSGLAGLGFVRRRRSSKSRASAAKA